MTITKKAIKSTANKEDHFDISIVVPVYNEEESLPHLLEQVSKAMAKTKFSWEIICVDDGSSDKSVEIMEELKSKYSELKPVYLRRNFGQTAAMQAGFDAGKGDVFITMDADLQNDPSDIPLLMKYIQKYDIVSGWRNKRKDDWLRSYASRRANKLISSVTGVELHDYGCTLKAYRREVVENVRIYGELHRFIPALLSQYGATIKEVAVNHRAREFGTSKYGMSRTFRVILDLILVKFILKYMNRPMHFFGMAGLACLTPGILLCTYLAFIKIFFATAIGGRPLLTLGVMLILIGVQLLGMGILGELLVRIYHEPSGRKQYVLKK